MTTPDRTIAGSKEAAQILMGRGGNPSTLPSRRVTILNDCQPPLAPLIKIAPSCVTVHRLTADVVQSDDSEVPFWVKITGPTDDNDQRGAEDDGVVVAKNVF